LILFLCNSGHGFDHFYYEQRWEKKSNPDPKRVITPKRGKKTNKKNTFLKSVFKMWFRHLGTYAPLNFSSLFIEGWRWVIIFECIANSGNKHLRSL